MSLPPRRIWISLEMERAAAVILLTLELAIQDDRLALIHIPLDLYPFFLQPVLQLLFHEVPALAGQNGEDADISSRNSFESTRPAFLNISITPVECSVVCSRELAELYFSPLAEKFNKSAAASGSRVLISREDFIVMQVDGQGLDAGQRVLELTSPLAMAGM
jgi:hypothetical protein